jgi:hypothetical protein
MAGLKGGRDGRGLDKSLGQEDDAVYEEHVLKTDDGVETSAQYEKFKSPVYPQFKRGFPRRFVDITPDEILYDPTRIMSRGIRARIWGTGQTVLYQPSVETEAMQQIQRMDCPPSQAPFECPPPFSQLPVVKRQIHLEPSRDAEIFRADGCIDVPASPDGIVPGTATVMTFDTFQQLRTIIRWTEMIVYDALCPSLITVEVKIEGSSVKWMANPLGSVTGSSGITYGTVSSPNAQDYSCLPDCCENSLIEITDRRHVEVVAYNLAPVDRKVEFCLWGWIESITMWDQAVKH